MRNGPSIPLLPLILERCVFIDGPGAPIQIGASDGLMDDPVGSSIVSLGLPALLVEPLPDPASVAGSPLEVREGSRRAGDPPRLVAQAERIRSALGWQPRHADLGGIVRDALAWERRLLERPMK